MKIMNTTAVLPWGKSPGPLARNASPQAPRVTASPAFGQWTMAKRSLVVAGLGLLGIGVNTQTPNARVSSQLQKTFDHDGDFDARFANHVKDYTELLASRDADTGFLDAVNGIPELSDKDKAYIAEKCKAYQANQLKTLANLRTETKALYDDIFDNVLRPHLPPKHIEQAKRQSAQVIDKVVDYQALQVALGAVVLASLASAGGFAAKNKFFPRRNPQ